MLYIAIVQGIYIFLELWLDGGLSPKPSSWNTNSMLELCFKKTLSNAFNLILWANLHFDPKVCGVHGRALRVLNFVRMFSPRTSLVEDFSLFRVLSCFAALWFSGGGHRPCRLFIVLTQFHETRFWRRFGISIKQSLFCIDLIMIECHITIILKLKFNIYDNLKKRFLPQ